MKDHYDKSEAWGVSVITFCACLLAGACATRCQRETLIRQLGDGSAHVEKHTFSDGTTKYRLIETKQESSK